MNNHEIAPRAQAEILIDTLHRDILAAISDLAPSGRSRVLLGLASRLADVIAYEAVMHRSELAEGEVSAVATELAGISREVLAAASLATLGSKPPDGA